MQRVTVGAKVTTRSRDLVSETTPEGMPGPAKRPPKAPSSGERNAVTGYFPQYEVAAGLLLHALTNETLECLVLLDPTAGQLDDFQLATPRRLDAYQIKWSQARLELPWGEIRELLRSLLRDRESLAKANTDRRVFGHLLCQHVPSANSRAGRDKGAPTTATFVAKALIPATQGAFDSPEDIPAHCRSVWSTTASVCGLTEEGLLSELRDVRLDFGSELPSVQRVGSSDEATYQKDLRDLQICLQRVATDPKRDRSRPVQLTFNQLMEELGGSWRGRLAAPFVNDFPRTLAYLPVVATVSLLDLAIQDHETGYVGLVGSPGSGKSTLLAQELQGRDDVAASYYAYIRGRADVGSEAMEAGRFLHDLVLTLERSGLPRGPSPLDFDVPLLSARLAKSLATLGETYRAEKKRSIIVVDGLDHVERAPNLAKPLFTCLPKPDVVPEGVLFVLGSQTLNMLDGGIRAQLEQPGRTVEMARLDRHAVAEIAARRGVSADVDGLHRVSDGHPLILEYLLEDLVSIPAADQDGRLAAMPRYAGGVSELYMRLWTTVEPDPILVELLALCCRLRDPVDFEWLVSRGQPIAAVRRLRDGLGHLFRREGNRWSFFHDSFRVFLRDHTGGSDEPEDKRLHMLLADMCDATPEEDPHSWERLFHLAAAGRHKGVLRLATPAFFRRQLLGMRPPELVAGDCRMAARSIGVVNDPMALVRLAIAAGELSQRSYFGPDRERFLSVLVGTGDWNIAVEHMRAEAESYGEDDPRMVRLRLSLELEDIGQHEAALSIFSANEPMGLLSGQKRTHSWRNPSGLLGAWSRAAAVFRGPAAVELAARRLTLPTGQAPFPGQSDDWVDVSRPWILALGSDELDDRDVPEGSDRLLAALDPSDEKHRGPWLWALRSRWAREGSRTKELTDLILSRFSPDDLMDEQRTWVADGLWRAGRPDAARTWIDTIRPPSLAKAGNRRLWDEEAPRYLLARLKSSTGQTRDEAVKAAVPASRSEWERGYHLVAQIVARIGALHGHVWAGQPMSAGEWDAATADILATFDSALRAEWSVGFEVGQVRPQALAQLLRVAALLGCDATNSLWAKYESRWQAKPGLLAAEGAAVILEALRRDAVPNAMLMRQLTELESVVQRSLEPGGAPEELTGLASTMLIAGRTTDAQRLLRQAVEATLAIHNRKDYQLSDWIDLLGPRLDGSQGRDLSRWLAGVLGEVTEQVSGTQTNHAARRLLAAESSRRPVSGWVLGAWLSDHGGIVDWDDRLEVLLETQSSRAADPVWWGLLSEAAVPIGVELSQILREGSRVAADSRGLSWLSERLRVLSDRLHVNAVPPIRDACLATIADVALGLGLSLDKVDIPAAFHPDTRPLRSYSRGTDEAKRDAFLEANRSVEKLLANAESADLTAERFDWVEAVERLADRMDSTQTERALGIFSGGDEHLRIRVRLAKRALVLGAKRMAVEACERIVGEASSRDWLRTWSGGPLLEAFEILANIDPSGTRSRAYQRLAADAGSDRFLLTELSRDLESYLELFGVADREALGLEIEAYVRILVEDPATQPPLAEVETPEGRTDLFARALCELLASPHRLAISSAQQGLLTALEAGDASLDRAFVEILQSDDEEQVLRALSVVSAAVVNGMRLSDSVLNAMTRWAVVPHLGIRVAAQNLLTVAGRPAAHAPYRALPSGYQLVFPRASHRSGHVVGRDDLDSALAALEPYLEPLAKAARLDPAAVAARVASVGREMAGNESVDDRLPESSGSSLGWTYFKPSVLLWDRAVNSVACEIADSGRLPEDVALRISSGPGFDAALIAARPRRRPSAVPPLSDKRAAIIDRREWLEGLNDAQSRLAIELESWAVIAEATECRYLDREIPYERRTQWLFDRSSPREIASVYLHGLPLGDLGKVHLSPLEAPVIGHTDPSFRGPSEWLSIHPLLADACGWSRDESELLSWGDASGCVATSIWWRSGPVDAADREDDLEVAEGWLVTVAPRGLAQLREVLGLDLTVAWKVERGLKSASQLAKDVAGERPLDSKPPR